MCFAPLPAGEAESEEDEWEGGESELTQAALRQLQQSPQFQGYLRVGCQWGRRNCSAGLRWELSWHECVKGTDERRLCAYM